MRLRWVGWMMFEPHRPGGGRRMSSAEVAKGKEDTADYRSCHFIAEQEDSSRASNSFRSQLCCSSTFCSRYVAESFFLRSVAGTIGGHFCVQSLVGIHAGMMRACGGNSPCMCSTWRKTLRTFGRRRSHSLCARASRPCARARKLLGSCSNAAWRI